jgi:serine/threonine-protein kinase
MESAVASAFAIPTAASAEARALASGRERADASAPDASTKTGRILTEAATIEHRVFVDGKSVGHGGTPIVVGCGRHLVRIGSTGPSKTIDVPCGGDVTVTR